MTRNRRIVFIALFCVCVAVGFWLMSRYPALSSKAAMSGTEGFEDKLSHEAYFHVPPGAELPTRILYTTLNWYETNWKGMSFGLVLAGAFLALLSYLPKKPSPNRFRNSLLGMLVGTPLGVCVNCVAPIAKGIYDAGSRMETALAVMFSSPTLNIVVLTMLFSIFPFYMAALKVGATILMVLVIVPFISKDPPRKKQEVRPEAPNPMFTECEVDVRKESWGEAFIGAVRDFLRSFKYIFVRTFPLMLLAGLMGAVLSHLITLDNFIGLKPDFRNLGVLAVLGTFLPLPIAFDIMLTQAMMMSKLADGFVMTLLFTLGTFSVYSAMVVARTFSLWVAVKLFVIVAAVGVGVGLAADRFSHHQHIQWLEQYDAFIAASPKEALTPVSTDLNALEPHPAPQTFAYLPTAPRHKETVMERDGVRIESTPHRARNVHPENEKMFRSVPGPEMGITYSNRLKPGNFIDPFYFGRGIASGDINRDGWVDVVVATDDGFEVYQNMEGSRFRKLAVPLGQIAGKEAINVALVDMDNDGWLDVFVTTFDQGNHLWRNPGHDTRSPEVVPVPNGDAVLTSALAFTDVNGDGFLDVANGNYFLGILTRTPVAGATNQLVLNDRLRFELKPLPGIPGQTHSVLFSDLNGDAVQDLMVGNDYRVADTYYFGEGGGVFKKIKRQDGTIPITTENTMSMDTGDLDNDLVPDLYLANIGMSRGIDVVSNIFGTFMQERGRTFCNAGTQVLEEKECGDLMKLVTLLNPEKQDIHERCSLLDNHRDIGDCMVTRMALLATRTDDPSLCAKIDPKHVLGRSMCDLYFEADWQQLNRDEEIRFRTMSNVLLKGNAGNTMEDVSEKMGVTTAEWSWNARFVDLDNDEWQDLYVVNGVLIMQEFTSNNFFHNQQGKTFVPAEEAFGLQDFDHSSAYTYIDFDNDGDLDLIINTLYGPFKVLINGERERHSVTVRLRDGQGNRDCIGCRVTIHYGPEGARHQMREIRAGGGFHSFDAAFAHFGLGSHDTLQGIEIRWTDGTLSRIVESLPANRDYLISRN
ncbi:FG-GAP-like repeat-containing protein [Nitrospina watsonii]|uniref:ASPIC/UnbV domain protein n=1 Tax=Nitrospina watsonii TaxID=1323948 RepID=A0ABN8VZE1_9BACT|nr:FG-GAP-like repeat-containing protein [Nitrospina watsonii]CAI2719149.1 Putative ASPIC/UnbV domain protein [Nitrospina watsonii]